MLDTMFLELEQADESAHMHIGGALIFDPLPGGRTPDMAELHDHLRERAPLMPRFAPAALGAARGPAPVADLGAGGRVRPRGPPQSRDPAGAGRRGGASRVARRLLVPSPRPPPPALGDDAPRRARGWALGTGHKDAPLPRRRRRLGRRRNHPARRLPSADGASPQPPPDTEEVEEGGGGRFWLSPGLVARGARAGVGAALHPRDSFDRARAALELIARDELIGAPHSSLNGPMSGTRLFATARFDLADIKETKNRLGGTVNDVVLALCAGGLRHLLLSRGDELPDGDLRAQVPVNIRPQDKEHALGNELTSLFVELPVTEEDPIARYHRVVERAEELKRGSQRSGGKTIVDLADMGPPLAGALLARSMFGGTRMFNLTITNVPGLTGAPVRARRTPGRGPPARPALRRPHDRHRRRQLRRSDGLRHQRRPRGGPGHSGPCRGHRALLRRAARRGTGLDPALAGKQRVDGKIEGDVVDDLGLAEDALPGEGQTLGQLLRSGVLGRNPDLDPVQTPGREGVPTGGPDRPGGDAAALALLVEPVADVDRAVGPIDRVEADDADDRRAVEDREVSALVVGRLPACLVDERDGVLDTSAPAPTASRPRGSDGWSRSDRGVPWRHRSPARGARGMPRSEACSSGLDDPDWIHAGLGDERSSGDTTVMGPEFAANAATVVSSLIAYEREILPVVRGELDRWRVRALTIPDPLLRAAALSALQAKGRNPEATAVFAILAPRERRAEALRAMAPLQIAIDYLDSLGEEPVRRSAGGWPCPARGDLRRRLSRHQAGRLVRPSPTARGWRLPERPGGRLPRRRRATAGLRAPAAAAPAHRQPLRRGSEPHPCRGSGRRQTSSRRGRAGRSPRRDTSGGSWRPGPAPRWRPTP